MRTRVGSTHTMIEAAYTGWWADILAWKISVMTAATNTDVTALSARARTDRVLAGHVEPDGVALHAGKNFVSNGDAWSIETRHDDGSLTVRHLEHRGRVRLPRTMSPRTSNCFEAETPSNG